MRRRIGLVAVLAIAAIAGAAFLLPHRSDFEAALSAAPVSRRRLARPSLCLKH